MIKKCLVCGREFSSPPSAGKVTCSRGCKCRRRSQLLRGHKVGADVKKKISAAAKERGQTENLKKGTPAAMQSPKSGRFETNSSAKDWTIMSPSGEVYNVVNLKNWIRENMDLFDDCYTDEDVNRISNGFRVVKNNMKRGKGTVTYKGWSILYCGTKNVEKERKKMKISYKRFQEIVHAAEEQEDQALFLAEYGLPEWIFVEVTDDEQSAVDLVTAVHRVTHMTPAELVKASGLTQTRFAARFMIPLRTVQNWCGEQREMPTYTKFMIAELLGLFSSLEITA